MSSRNRFLGPAERQAATVLYRALTRAREAVDAGDRQGDRIRQILIETVRLETSARLDYAEVADACTLEPLGELRTDRPAMALLAAHVGSTRLIDNMPLTE